LSINRKIVLFLLIAFLALSSWYNLVQINKINQPEEIEEICQDFHIYLYQIQGKIEDYYQENGNYPSSLDSLNIHDDYLEYKLKTDDHYSITLQWYECFIYYDSLEPAGSILTKESMDIMRERNKNR
jgi:hypothetical protein